MSILWITPQLGTAPALLVQPDHELNIVDVRDLVDKAGNRAESVRKKIDAGCAFLREGKKVVVCCDYGISRSNAVAVGILALYESIPFEAALRRVLDSTGGKEIKIAPLQAVRLALGQDKKKSSREKPNLLVTGGNGTLGKPTILKLKERFAVVGPDRAELDLRTGSANLNLIVGENNIDCIVHLANPRVFTSNIALGDTLTMLRNVLDVCTAHRLKLIYLSGWEVYSGYRSTCLRADESIPLFPKGPYAETKYLCELLIEHCRRTQDLDCAMLRSGPVYGVGSDKPKFIYNFIDKIKRSQTIKTHRYANGLPALDLLYIDDLVDAIARAVDNDFAGNLNIGTGILTPTRRVAEMLRDLLYGQNEIDSALIEGDSACIAMDAGRAELEIGWKATVALEDGLRRIVSHLNTAGT